MTITVGARVGPYEMIDTLGAGGMGVVYRAKDTRIGREVAVKLLPSAYAGDEERLRRFEHEAKTTGMLNHPNILAIYDVGSHEGVPYLVSELLEGETLRNKIGALSVRKSIEYAVQLAHGLAAAHEKGIVHRDLKPENIFITRDGRVKILDFGLAKLQLPEHSPMQSELPTVVRDTEPGTVMGTVGYMSPEQVRGKQADHRSDVFSFGAILYEMVSGKRAFQGQSAVETMSAILKEDPPELSANSQNLPAALDRIVRHCLEKDAEERFQSMRDVAFYLEALSGISTSTASLPVAKIKQRRFPIASIAGLLIVAAITAFVAGRYTGSVETPPPPSFKQITFSRGDAPIARFAPDGQTILYTALWNGKDAELFTVRPESPESRSLGLANAILTSVSPSAEMALLLGDFHSIQTDGGTLARASLGGGSPREMLEHIYWAEWGPDGTNLIVVKSAPPLTRIEYPQGKKVFEAFGFITHVRLSPKKDQIAFIHHKIPGDDAGVITVVNFDGKSRELSRDWNSTSGLAWSPTGDEVWFTATKTGNACALYGVTLDGKERLISRVPGKLVLHDISPDGRALLGLENFRATIVARIPGAQKEIELTLHDRSISQDISMDGKILLFSEHGEAGGEKYSVYIRKIDGQQPVKLGIGTANSISPDGKWVLSVSKGTIFVLPTGAGDVKQLAYKNFSVGRVAWHPDGKRIIAAAQKDRKVIGTFELLLDGSEPKPLTQQGITGVKVSPDGKHLLTFDSRIVPLSDGQPYDLAGKEQGYTGYHWKDSDSVYAFRNQKSKVEVLVVNIHSGQITERNGSFGPEDQAGVIEIYPPQFSADGKTLVYTYFRSLTDLYLVEGLK